METLISVDESAFQVEWGNAKDLRKCGSSCFTSNKVVCTSSTLFN